MVLLISRMRLSSQLFSKWVRRQPCISHFAHDHTLESFSLLFMFLLVVCYPLFLFLQDLFCPPNSLCWLTFTFLPRFLTWYFFWEKDLFWKEAKGHLVLIQMRDFLGRPFRGLLVVVHPNASVTKSTWIVLCLRILHSRLVFFHSVIPFMLTALNKWIVCFWREIVITLLLSFSTLSLELYRLLLLDSSSFRKLLNRWVVTAE
jgi:hypothetical protein